MNHQEDSQQQISDGEVMTTAIVAPLYYSGNFEKGRKAMSQPQYIPNMISRSRFNRRLHRVEPMLLVLFEALGQAWKHLNSESVYSIDAFPSQFVTISVSQGQKSMVVTRLIEVIKPVRSGISMALKFI